MLRKSTMALLAVGALALLMPEEASARGMGGGFRGGGGSFHGGGGFRAAGIGMGGGYRAAAIGGGYRAAAIGGGYRAAAIGGGYRVAAVRTGTFANNAWRTGYYPGYRPWRRYPVAAAVAVGAGLAYGAYPYGYYDDASYGSGYYDNGYYNNGYYNGGYYNSGYYPPYDSEGNYVYNAGGYYGDGGCYIVQRRVPTPYGWVLRPIQVCN